MDYIFRVKIIHYLHFYSDDNCRCDYGTYSKNKIQKK